MLDYRARFYHPGLGRFLSPDTIIPDPSNPQDLNRFSYVANNPLRYTDPTGHKRDPDCGCAGLNWEKLTGLYERAAEAAGDSYRGTLNEYLFARAVEYYALSEGNYIAAQAQRGIIEGSLLARLRTSGYYGSDVAIDTVTSVAGVDVAGNALEGLGGISLGVVVARRMTSDQQALKELVDEETLGGRKPLSTEDADTILDWAEEVDYPGIRANPDDLVNPSHWTGHPDAPPHIHIPGAGRGGHVPVEPGVAPRPWLAER